MPGISLAIAAAFLVDVADEDLAPFAAKARETQPMPAPAVIRTRYRHDWSNQTIPITTGQRPARGSPVLPFTLERPDQAS
jgi:hypothetical protein